MKARIRIGELAARTGCSPEIVRHYERRGLLPKPQRGSNGYRYYDAAAVKRLGFIRRCRELGLDLATIHEIVELAEQPGANCATVDALVRRHAAAIRARIRILQRLADELESTARQCRGGRITECRILETLTPDWFKE